MEIRRAWTCPAPQPRVADHPLLSAAGAGRLPIDGTLLGLSEPRPRRNQGDKMTM
jgi:hypothetical protein